MTIEHYASTQLTRREAQRLLDLLLLNPRAGDEPLRARLRVVLGAIEGQEARTVGLQMELDA